MSTSELRIVEPHEVVIKVLEVERDLAVAFNGPESEQVLRLTERIDIRLQRIEEIEAS